MDIEKMSLESLENYLIVLNYIRKEAELNNRFDFVCLGHENVVGKNLKDIDCNDYYKIFWSLLYEEVFGASTGDNGNIFLNIDKDKFYKLCSDVEDRIKLLKGGSVDKIFTLSFDSVSSVLTINNYKIRIRRQTNDNHAHSVLKHIFENGLDQQFFYSELLEDILGIKNFSKTDWKKIERACKDIQEKVQKGTNFQINDFLDYNTGITGSVRIQRKYLIS
jgi:hypothetical protein